MTTYHRIISSTLAVAAALALGAAAGPASARPYDLNGHASYVPRAPGAPVTAGQPSSNGPSLTGQQGAPPILPAPTPSQSAAIKQAEQHAAHRPTLPNVAKYSNAEMNAYPSGLTTSPTGEQGAPPILPALTPSQSAAIQQAEEHAAQRPTLPKDARYSNAETNAYPSDSTTSGAIVPDGGFDWGDAGIGAAGGFAIAILGVGGGFALSQRRSRSTGTSAIVTG